MPTYQEIYSRLCDEEIINSESLRENIILDFVAMVNSLKDNFIIQVGCLDMQCTSVKTALMALQIS